MSRSVTVALTCTLVVSTAAQTPSPDLRTRAEISNYEATSTYADVTRIVDAIAKASPNAATETFGKTEEGRALPLLTLSEPKVTTPEAARKLGRPIVFVMANIHAGEVEGKEAALILARRLTGGDLRPLLSQVTVLIAPIYNADGNERVSVENRTQQYGPVAGMGTRENAKRLDLNRDYMKLDSAEARALVGLLARWDPHVVVDLHTTNGSYHGYHLTYAPTLNPTAPANLIAFERDVLLPAAQQAVQQKHQFRTYFYGNFANESTLARETSRVDPKAPGDTVWRTFDHRPRFGNNYTGLRNRIAVLSEAYSYADFQTRVRVTEVFVEAILRASAEHAARILSLTAAADREIVEGKVAELGVEARLAPSPAPVEILVGDVDKKPHPKTGKEMLVMADQVTPVRMKDYGLFETTKRVRVPRGWLLSKAAIDSGRLSLAVERLRVHGVRMQPVSTSASVPVEQFSIADVTRAERAFQGRNETQLKGTYAATELKVEPGSLFVPAAQPLARLAFYLLEAESDDSFAVWNVIDGFKPGELYPVVRVMDEARLALGR